MPGARNPYYGAVLAAPAFKAIADRVYALDATAHSALTETPNTFPASVKGGNLTEIREVASTLSVPADVSRRERGWVVTRRDSARVEVVPINPVADTMPAVTGMAFKDALYLLERQGLNVRFTGRGMVTSQSVKAGSPIREGETVTLNLRPVQPGR